ncbi:FmdB family zinc ribbon protein [Intrasporangium sp.]|uniref:FmdB family zinc ribbon protein n=1 Tax=Intrasporangium sp. TaxID=1925024 RepID=UPI0033653EE4
MPTYSYACTQCGHAFDIRQSFTDDPLTDCPECADGAGRLRKVIHPVGIAFKGSGFYKTDSRASGGTKGSGGKESGAGSGSGEAAASTSSESAGSSGSSESSGGSGSSSSGPSTGASGSGGSSSGSGSGSTAAAS